jgi:hypothetical protein
MLRVVGDEWQMVRDALTEQGVAGADDLGRLVSNTDHFRPSALDERAATSVFIELLPRLSDPKLVGAIASHLRSPWARPAASQVLQAAFERWAITETTTGWHIGDALATVATEDDLPALLQIVTATRFGTARQMIVDALWRFKAAPEVEPTLVLLTEDPDVALHAMSSLRRAVGPKEALQHLHRVEAEHSGDSIGTIARRQIRKAEATLRKRDG